MVLHPVLPTYASPVDVLVEEGATVNRRGFLTTLAAAAAGAALDPERLLWVPGEKTVILPPAGGWIGVDFGWSEPEISIWRGGIRGGKNELLTVDMITKEALKVLDNNLKLAKELQRRYNSIRSAAYDANNQCYVVEDVQTGVRVKLIDSWVKERFDGV